ncbi:MAG TPA: hypothetical protein VMS99_06415 [Acidimicrobiia bacterium]|nr:hypothetical protein [Acidimicrobiia bacterium]
MLVNVVLLVGLLSLNACVVTDGGGTPLPSAAVEVSVDLVSGATETYEFEFEVEALFGREGFRVSMEPTPEAFTSDGVRTERSWTTDGSTQSGWPVERVIVESGELIVGTLILTLENATEGRITTDLTVTISASPLRVPGPTEETLELSITQR